MKKILLIEDDEIMSRMYKKLFSYKGYSIETAGDGQEGLAKAQKTKPDIILLDVMMPKLNGLQVLDRLKKDPKTRDIQVVLLSNLSIQDELDKALDKGIIKYIIKRNHEPDEIFKIVEEIIASKDKT